MAHLHTFLTTSSIHERRPGDDQSRLPFPYASREVAKIDHRTLHPESRYEESLLNFSHPHCSTSKQTNSRYEEAPAMIADMYQLKQETSLNQPREQLPPLSSLFGSSSAHQIRPGQSPYSERQSPVFPDSRPVQIPAERSYDISYFQRPPVSRQYSFGSRNEQEDRFEQHHQAGYAGGRPVSPRTDSKVGAPLTTRTQLPSSSSENDWTSHSRNPRSDYYSRDTSSSFRPRLEHRPQPPPIHRTEHDSRSVYRTGYETPSSKYPPTPASTIAGDIITVKDGLGPKIWTGTQFLPRFVRQAEVPGEGVCYFYDDGTHCKSTIDGEAVNAHWGVTKAGKPRKRLAIACITCRDKKIKCDPDYPRCVQCEKFGRVCKFKNAPRGGQGSPDTPPADMDETMTGPGSLRGEGETSFKLEKRESQSLSPLLSRQQPSPESELHQPKRQRTRHSDYTSLGSDASPRVSVLEAGAPLTPWIEPIVSSPIDHNLLHQWQKNPFTLDESLVTEMVSMFFQHVPEMYYSMFPEGLLRSWILSPHEKSLDDLMLIYTILAIGTVFSPKPEHKALGVRYAAISRYACDNRHFSIQLVQSRLILSSYYFAINNHNDAWDFCGSALRAASRMKLNLEMEKSDDIFLKTFPFGLTRAGYAECRRRTFWSCYLVDRFNGFCSGNLSFFNSEDVFLRLPCDTKSFEAQLDVQNPFFDVSKSSIQGMNWTVGSTGYLVQIATIWGDVIANIFRTSQRPAGSTSNPNFADFYNKITQRVHEWRTSLPARYQFPAETLHNSKDNETTTTCMAMHVVYHTTMMKLNRYIQQSALTNSERESYIKIARKHAEELLVMMDNLARSSSHFSFPFTGFAIVSAVDILTAKFKPEDIPTCLASISGAQTILSRLTHSWQSAKTQQALLQQRVAELKDLMHRRGSLHFVMNGEIEGALEMREPMENMFGGRSYDCFYT